MNSELVEDPVLHQRYRFSRKGNVQHLEVWADPGSAIPEHVHPAHEERWEVVEGDVTFRVDRRRREAHPGDRVVLAPGVRHGFENTGASVAHLRVEADVALRLQELLEEAAALNRAGALTPSGMPKSLGALLAVADFTERHRATTVFLSPPPVVQRIFCPPLAALERRRRARAATAATS